ncbi:hypothetical protein [Herbidospora sp. RD11066]
MLHYTAVGHEYQSEIVEREVMAELAGILRALDELPESGYALP